MGISVQVSRTGIQAVERLARMFGSNAILKTIGLDQLSWINQNFERQGIERHWPPLAPSTVYARRKGSAEPLQDTGRLRQSFVKGQPFAESPAEIEIGSRIEYAAYHHFGTSPYVIRPKRKKRLAFAHPAGPVVLANTQRREHRGKRGFITQMVHHPGLPPRPLLPTERTAQMRADSVVQQMIRDADRGPR